MPMNHSEMEQAIRSLREKVTIYEEVLKETRRSEDRAKLSEDRLYRMVLVVFSAVGVIFAGLLGYNTWNINRVYNEITDRVNVARGSLETQYNNALATQRDEFEKLEGRLSNENTQKFNNSEQGMYKDIAARSATMPSQTATMWTVLRDPERSLDAAIEAFNKAMESGSNSWADALSGMNNALQPRFKG